MQLENHEVEQASSKARLTGKSGAKNYYATYHRFKVPLGLPLLDIEGDPSIIKKSKPGKRKRDLSDTEGPGQPTFIRLNSGDLLQVFRVMNFPIAGSIDLDGDEFAREGSAMKAYDPKKLEKAEETFHRAITRSQHMQRGRSTKPAPLLRAKPRTTISEFELSPGSFSASVTAQLGDKVKPVSKSSQIQSKRKRTKKSEAKSSESGVNPSKRIRIKERDVESSESGLGSVRESSELSRTSPKLPQEVTLESDPGELFIDTQSRGQDIRQSYLPGQKDIHRDQAEDYKAWGLLTPPPATDSLAVSSVSSRAVEPASPSLSAFGHDGLFADTQSSWQDMRQSYLPGQKYINRDQAEDYKAGGLLTPPPATDSLAASSVSSRAVEPASPSLSAFGHDGLFAGTQFSWQDVPPSYLSSQVGINQGHVQDDDLLSLGPLPQPALATPSATVQGLQRNGVFGRSGQLPLLVDTDLSAEKDQQAMLSPVSPR